MALTNLSTPETHTPCYNPQTFCFSSSNVGQPNFTYNFILTINSVVVERDIDANPSDNKFYFDAQGDAMSYCHNEFYPNINDFQFSIDGAIRKVEWSIQEKYGSPPTLQGAATTGTYYVWNAAYKTKDFPSYVYSAGSLAKDLTLVPDLTDTIHYDQKYLFKRWHRAFASSNLRYLNLKCYNSNGSITLQDAILENQFYNAAGVYQRNHLTLNCSPYGLNNITGTAIISQSQPGALVPTNTAYYTITLSATNFGTPNTNTYTVYLDDFCSNYDRYVLHFLNRLGNYDSFTFNKLSRPTFENKQSKYKKYPLSNISNKLSYNSYDSDTANYSTVITDKLLLNSKFITEAQMIWLTDLLNSPSVYLENSDNELYAVELTSRGPFEEKKKANDKIFNLTIEVEYSFEDTRQRG